MNSQLQDIITEQTQTIKKLTAEVAELRHMLFKKRGERMPPVTDELKRRRKTKEKDEETARRNGDKKRKENAAKKKTLPTVDVVHPIPPENLRCPRCGGDRFIDLGEGEVSYEYDYVPPQFIRRKHIRQKKACTCGACVLTALAPLRVCEGGLYGPGLYANAIVGKCCDSLPLYRQTRQLQRAGITISRSTLGDLFHRAAGLLSPLHVRMLELVRSQTYVNADETRISVMAPVKTKTAYIWTFIADNIVTYVFSSGRSGKTPIEILGNSPGVIQVDGYSGYNAVCTPDSRKRAGCMAHARRYIFKALEEAEVEARWVLERILDLYQIEYVAAERHILGMKEHLRLRQDCSKPLMDEIELYLEDEKPQHLPKGLMGRAITYFENNWDALSLFLTDPKIKLDNNISEGMLRIIALGRSNFLFLGNKESGENLATLQTLTSSCIVNKVNPQAYLEDVLLRIQTHPASQLDELLPHNWKPEDSS